MKYLLTYQEYIYDSDIYCGLDIERQKKLKRIGIFFLLKQQPLKILSDI